MQFTALEDFYSPELKSQYCKGLSYTLRAIPPNPLIDGDKGIPAAETPLAKLLPEWVKQGKVRAGGVEVAVGKNNGSGDVT